MFSTSAPLGSGTLDANVGLDAQKTYTHAFNLRGGTGTLAVNGVNFTNLDVGNYSGVDGAFGLSGFFRNTTGGSVIGSGSGLNTLLNTFVYDGSPQTLALSNLVAGQTYVLTLYNKSWGPAGGDRIQALTSSGGATGRFDENMGGEPNAHLLRYTFTANAGAEAVTFTKQAAGSLHLYGFTTEQVFNNAWSGGAAWSAATWGAPGTPGAAGDNADFPAQPAPAALELDAPVTVGHLRFDGANPWTLFGDDTLTLLTDAGGVSVLSTPSGAHAISNGLAFANAVMKAGDGTLTLAGAASGTGPVTVDAGTLELAATNALPARIDVEVATNALLRLSFDGELDVARLTFGGALQRRGTWGAPGSGADYVSDRLDGAGVLRVLGGPALGVFTASGNLGGGDLDAAVGLDAGLDYFGAVNVYGGALTINGVAFDGSAGGNPAGVAYALANFGNVNNTAQSTVTGQLGLLLNDFNYGNGTTPQTLTLRNLIAGRTYALTFYNRVWRAGEDRTQTFTTTSGATTNFNADAGAANTASWLRYTFLASGGTETVTISPTNGASRSFHLYGFSVTEAPPAAYTDLTRRDSGVQAVPDAPLDDVRVVEGTGTPGDLTLGAYAATVNSLLVSDTEDTATLNLAGGVLATHGLRVEADAGGLAISNGVVRGAATALVIDNRSTNPVVIAAAIGNGSGPSSLSKAGAGTLTLSGANAYSGGTTVNAGTLRVIGGTLGGGVLTADGGDFRLEGGTVTSADWETYRNSVVTQTGGTMNHGFYFQSGNTRFDLTGGSSGCAGEALLGFYGGTNVTVNIGGTHVSDWLVARFSGGPVVMNLSTGGTLRVDELSNTGASGLIRFDGGTLAVSARQPARTPGDWIRAGNSVAIADGGAVIDTANGSVAINRPLLQEGASAGGLTKTGTNTLTLTALGTYAGETRVQGGTLKLAPTPVAGEGVNLGFEKPAYAANGWSYLTDDGQPGGWAFAKRDDMGNGGIARNGSPWVAAGAAPEGVQAGFLQRNCDVSQTFRIRVAGAYRLTFKAANRPTKGAVELALLIDGVTNGWWSVATIDGGGVFKPYAVELGVLTAGTHELRYSGRSPDGADRATAIDAVAISWSDDGMPGPLPTETRLAVAAGCAVDVSGANQSVAALSGPGRIINTSSTNVALTVGGGGADSLFEGTVEGGVVLAKAGAGALVVSGSNTYSGATVVSGGTLCLPLFGAAVPVENASFETHDPLPNSGVWGYTPTNATWVFVSAGISTRQPPWISASAGIDGTYAGFIQRSGTISQPLAVATGGWYTVSFLAGKRPGYPATSLYVDVDGVNQFWFTNTVFTDAGGSFSGTAFLPTGTPTLRFRGNSSDDQNTWIDRVELTALGGSLPTGTVVTVAAGAVLELNGNTQALAGLSGSGTVRNGALTLTGVVAPGGSNTVGTLTLALTPAFSGATLLADAAAGGACDLLSVQGDLALDGLTLAVADLDALEIGRVYTIAACTGALTGTFDATNLPEPWRVLYDRAAGEVSLTRRTGTLIMVH